MNKTDIRLIVGLLTAVVVFACARGEADFLSTNAGIFGGATRGPDFVSLAKNLQPRVVNVSAILAHNPSSDNGKGEAGSVDSEVFGVPPAPEGAPLDRSQGSGFVIGADGLILTNAHVIDGAKKIVVRLTDKREFDAKVVGKDVHTDVAVLKIFVSDQLPAFSLGDSDDLQVGEWVMAIGNPFGLESSVSSGIVSAKGRHLGEAYDRLIQTDALLNPGNSGGPLVNARGDVIGVNTFIFTKSGGSEGIGFAIPIDVAKKIVEEVVRYGRIRNVWIGVRTWDLTPYLAERLGTSNRQGLYVASMERGSPADKAGVRVGDIIRRVNGTPVRDSDEAYRAIFGANVGDTITLTVERDGKELAIKLLLEEAPE
jgi:serine protease Do